MRLPRFAREPAVRAFGRIFGVDFSEVRDPLGSFPSIQDFFVRRLKPGVRPEDSDPTTFVSPCDGAWGAWGEVEAGTLLQVKGRPYSLAELLGDPPENGTGGGLAGRFEGGTYLTLYLSPRDYHRFHTPCRGSIFRTRYLPGGLWPVNRAGLTGVDGLFARNERICAFARVEGVGGSGAGTLAMVAVGATLVGKVKLQFDDLETNLPGAAAAERSYDPPVELERAEEWGRFEFGSTLVLIATPGLVMLEGGAPGAPVRLGLRLGVLGSRRREECAGEEA